MTLLPPVYPGALGILYIFIGIFGSVCNLATALIIIRYHVYRLSAYTLMANIAIADTVILIFAGFACGTVLLQFQSHTINTQLPLNVTPTASLLTTPRLFNNDTQYFINDNQTNLAIQNATFIRILQNADTLTDIGNSSRNTTILLLPKASVISKNDNRLNADAIFVSSSVNEENTEWRNNFNAVLSFFGIAAWITNGFSYALLGLNRCVAICFFHTRARVLNTVRNAVLGSSIAWIFGISIAALAAFPEPLFRIRKDLWTVSFISPGWRKQVFVIIFAVAFNGLSILVQILCSTLVLTKIRTVKRKINANALKKSSAFRFIRQAELTLQFFYPSVVCATATFVYLARPFIVSSMPHWLLVLKHIVWMLGHSCNPLIYAYYNECMRASYRSWLTCLPLRGHYKRSSLPRHSINLTGRMKRPSHMYTKTSLIRNSLQVQSRNFEQLCQFMMKINMASDTHEGWVDNSNESEDEV
uniref:7TM_GPCR_Srx domain-containing protein n=1 Tax=Syphacia muris TaxID=451379 RepID=A0A0N5B052_9BILA